MIHTPITKICNICGMEKQITEFYYFPHQAKPYDSCRECLYKKANRASQERKKALNQFTPLISIKKRDRITMDVIKYGKIAKGRSEFLRYLELNPQDTLTMLESIHAKCYDCMGFYADGVVSCEQNECPLYKYHKYRSPPHSSASVSPPQEAISK